MIGLPYHYKYGLNPFNYKWACDERSLEVVKATTKALIDTAPEKQPQGCFFQQIKRADE